MNCSFQFMISTKHTGNCFGSPHFIWQHDEVIILALTSMPCYNIIILVTYLHLHLGKNMVICLTKCFNPETFMVWSMIFSESQFKLISHARNGSTIPIVSTHFAFLNCFNFIHIPYYLQNHCILAECSCLSVCSKTERNDEYSSEIFD